MKNRLSGKQILAVGIYVVGIICVVYFLMAALLGGEYVSNPDAMIPYTDFEANMMILGVVFLPMAAACLFVIHAFGVKKWLNRIMICVPGIITAFPFTIGVVLLLIMYVMGLYEAYSGMIG